MTYDNHRTATGQRCLTIGHEFELATQNALIERGWHVRRLTVDEGPAPTDWQTRYKPDLIASKMGRTRWIDCKASSYNHGQSVSISRAALGAGLLFESDGRPFWYIFDNGRCATPTHLMQMPHRWAIGAMNGSGQPRIQVVATQLPFARDMFR